MLMGILDFFRRKTPEPEVEPEEIAFDEIEVWLNCKVKELREKEKGVFDLIDEKVELFVSDIDVKLKVLEGIDVEVKKVEERAKRIVRQGLDKYISYVHVFVRELKEVERKSLESFIGEVNNIFSDFDKHSYIFYQRATFLIGDEIAAVKEKINHLSKYFTKLFKESDKIINSLKLVSSVRLNLVKIGELNDAVDKINLEVKVFDEKVKDKEMKVKDITQEIEKVKISKDYLDNLKLVGKIKLVEKQLSDDVLVLKGLVDFKVLSNVFHSHEKKMRLIKSYKENFRESLAKDGGEGILRLIGEAELDSDGVRRKIKDINDLKEKIVEDKKLILEDAVIGLSSELDKIEKEIENLKIEKVKHVKRGEGVLGNKVEIVEEIGREVKGLGGILLKPN